VPLFGLFGQQSIFRQNELRPMVCNPKTSEFFPKIGYKTAKNIFKNFTVYKTPNENSKDQFRAESSRRVTFRSRPYMTSHSE